MAVRLMEGEVHVAGDRASAVRLGSTPGVAYLWRRLLLRNFHRQLVRLHTEVMLLLLLMLMLLMLLLIIAVLLMLLLMRVSLMSVLPLLMLVFSLLLLLH